MYSGKSLVEVAGYDDTQVCRVLWLKRSSDGSLVRSVDEASPGCEVDETGQRVVSGKRATFKDMFFSVKKFQGTDPVAAWLKYVDDTPSLKKLLDGRQTRR